MSITLNRIIRYKISFFDLDEENLNPFLSEAFHLSVNYREVSGVSIFQNNIEFYNRYNLRLILWDTSLKERFRFIFPTFIHGSRAIIFYLTQLSNQHLDKIKNIFNDISKVLKERFIPIFLIYNPNANNTTTLVQEQDNDRMDSPTRIDTQSGYENTQDIPTFDMNKFFLKEETITKNLLEIYNKYEIQGIIKLKGQDEAARLQTFGLIAHFIVAFEGITEDSWLQTRNRFMLDNLTNSVISHFENESVSIVLFQRKIRNEPIRYLRYSNEIWPRMESLFENVRSIAINYPANTKLPSPEVIKNDKQFQRFLKMGKKCPICGKENEESYLQKFYYSKDKEKIAIKESVLYLMDELDLEGLNSKDNDNDIDNDIDSVYIMDSNKIRIGIPCCDCYKKYFKKD